MPKTLLELSMPMIRAASETRRMKGNMMRVSRAVSAAFSGSKPGARAATSWLENTIPAIHRSPSTPAVRVATLFARRHAESSPPRAMVLLKVVTNAVDSAPSANRSRSRFGIRNAAVKASIAAPPPNRAAKICSRASPSSRLHITARPMIPAALVFSFSVRSSGATAAAGSDDEALFEFGPLTELMHYSLPNPSSSRRDDHRHDRHRHHGGGDPSEAAQFRPDHKSPHDVFTGREKHHDGHDGNRDDAVDFRAPYERPHRVQMREIQGNAAHRRNGDDAVEFQRFVQLHIHPRLPIETLRHRVGGRARQNRHREHSRTDDAEAEQQKCHLAAERPQSLGGLSGCLNVDDSRSMERGGRAQDDEKGDEV